MKKEEKPKYSMWQNISFMIKLAWKNRRSVLFLCGGITALRVAERIIRLFITPVILGKVEQQADLQELLWTIVGFSMALFAVTVVKKYAEQNTRPARVDVRSRIVSAINNKACTTSYPNTKDTQILKLQESAMDATSANARATEHIWHTLTELVINIISFLFYLVLLSHVNIFLIGIVLATAVVGFFVEKQINEWEYRHKEEQTTYSKRMNYVLNKSRSVEMAKDIRIFGLGEWLEEVYNKSLDLLDAFLVKREKIYIWSNVVDIVLAFARNGIAYFYLIDLVLENNLTASEFLLYFTAVSGFTSWVTNILSGVSGLHKECLDISKVQEYLNLEEPFRFEDGEDIPEAAGFELQLDRVSFKYPESDKYIVQNLNLKIKAGEKLAIVGLNGAGKTTLVRILCGFYDPTEGRVLLNGKDIRQFNRRKYYELFSAVFQEFSVLDVTVAETVAQSTKDIDLNRVMDCIEKAGLTEQVAKYPNGLQTHVGRDVYLDGVLLSGGQMQRLMLARALYKDGPILVLDEPTAALDPIAENDTYMKYNEMTAGKTSVFISHRLASTRFCDRIIFLADGVIIEEGTHEELLRKGGEYAKLFEVQSRYYQEGGREDGEERKD